MNDLYNHGVQTICYVWSLTDDIADIPYRIDLISYTKSPKKTCTCPSFVYGKGRACKHIRLMKEKSKDKSILHDEHFQVTEFGKQYLKL